MNWITNFVKPKIQSFIGLKKDVPDNLWVKCPKCDHMLFNSDLKSNLNVCNYCNHHLRITPKERLKHLFDDGFYTIVEIPKVIQDPLKFKDSKKYTDRLKEYRAKTSEHDSAIVAVGKISKKTTCICVYNFDFMGGSMGMYAGQAMVEAAKVALSQKAALIAISASGGARMQEGILSLMQMPRTTIAVKMMNEAKLPYITILSDPTTGGVSASFAMLGDIAIAEPGATIGFTGARVIEETIKQKLPQGFQSAEYLLEHGMIDMVVNRKDMAQTIGKILKHLMN